ncbi:hypothetical protein QTP86_027521 [Hemibagrus guttatus]|nr:hypothetical protein QTP86_027521 [Hemibagrus guttatus]
MNLVIQSTQTTCGGLLGCITFMKGNASMTASKDHQVSSVARFVHNIEIDRRIGAAAAVMRSIYRSVVVKKELSRKAKLLIYQSIYVPTLTYGHELWVMTERVRSRIQAAEMGFLRRVAGRSLRDRVRSSVTREARSRAAAPPHRKGTVEVARASVSDAS